MEPPEATRPVQVEVEGVVPIGRPTAGHRRVKDQVMAAARVEPQRRRATVTVARQALAPVPEREAQAPDGVVQERDLQRRGPLAGRAPGLLAERAAVVVGVARARLAKVGHLLGGPGAVEEGVVCPVPTDGRPLTADAGARPPVRLRVGADTAVERMVTRRATA